MNVRLIARKRCQHYNELRLPWRHFASAGLLLIIATLTVVAVTLVTAGSPGDAMPPILGLLVGCIAIHACFMLPGKRAASEISRSLRKNRKDQSRHEWIQEKSLDEIAAQLEALRGEVARLAAVAQVPKPRPVNWSDAGENVPRVLFVTSNGFGMGHITRCLAITRAAGNRFSASIITLSAGFRDASERFPIVSHFPSPDSVPWRRSVWQSQFCDFLVSTINREQPAIVVFDGTVIYSGVQRACVGTRTPLVWMRRGMWRASASRKQFNSSEEYSDLLIVPGEFREAVRDNEADKNAHVVEPIVIRRLADLKTPDEARESLGLPRKGKYSVVQLGSAEIEGTGSLTQYVVRKLREIDPQTIPVVAQSPISTTDDACEYLTLHGAYPLADCLSAFEYGVTAAGYNTVHECIEMNLPTVMIPNQKTVTDDQLGRASTASADGLTFLADNKEGLDNALERIVHADSRREMLLRLKNIASFCGADQAAQALTEYATMVEQKLPSMKE